MDKFPGNDHFVPQLLGIGISEGSLIIASNGRCWDCSREDDWNLQLDARGHCRSDAGRFDGDDFRDA